MPKTVRNQGTVFIQIFLELQQKLKERRFNERSVKLHLKNNFEGNGN